MRPSVPEAMGADAAAAEQFGPYLVYERLGVGGMATVHRALERGIEGFERIVALKRLLPHLAADASFIKSFVREAKLASLLNHVNIVQIFELGRVGSQYFISMEHIDGRDIRRILRHARKASGPPPIHVTVGLLLQLCDALDYAHHKVDDTGHPLGLVHRDVSPSNVLVTTAGQVKVIDFGIAKAQSSQLRTQTGRVKGKIAYMAPEALAGKDLDARSDLFAVGVIGHELLTARPLFATKNEYQTLMKVQRGDILPPSSFNQGCPAELDAVVLRALARDPDQRFRHASALRDDLNAIRKQYNLATSNRDIATWLEWAFSLEVPTGSFAIGSTLDHTPGSIEPRSSPRSRPSRPKRSEDDEVVDLAWGGAEEHHSGDPLVLDDVPDVTDKHLTSARLVGADVRLDVDDLVDDIPTPVPSHGVRPTPSISSRTVTTPIRPPRARAMTPAPVRRSQVVPAQAPPRERRAPTNPPARTTQDGIAPPGAGVGAGIRSAAMPSRVRTITIPPLTTPSLASSPRTVPSLAPPPPATPATSAGDIPEASTPPRGVTQASPTPRGMPQASPTSRGHRTPSPSAIHMVPRPDLAATERTPALTVPPTMASDGLVTERTPALSVPPTTPAGSLTTERPPELSADDLAMSAETMPSMPAAPSAEATVRFRAATNSPAATTPGPPARAGARRSRIVTPATELFAEPEPEADASSSRSRTLAASVNEAQRPSSDLAAPASAAVRAGASRLRGMLVMLVVFVLVGTATSAGYLYLTRYRDRGVPVVSPRPPIVKTSGTLRLVIVPPDAVVTIGGKPMHTGSPWDVDLAPGIHQIEIHRDGYKTWLTSTELAAGETQMLRFVLDPFDAAVTAEATLIVSSTPPALEVMLDGMPTGARTPIRMPIKPGSHTIALRRNGVDVWQRMIDARASAVYELNPAITDAGDPGDPGDPGHRAPRPARQPTAAGPGSAASPPAPDQAPVAPPPPAGSAAPLPATVPTAPSPPPTSPVSVSPAAVTQISGRLPNPTKIRGVELPSAISAKLCIDEAGQVTSSEVLTELPATTAAEIVAALRSWRYTPYKVDGVARAACFIMTFRTR
jgi:serine/threonine protein kinase